MRPIIEGGDVLLVWVIVFWVVPLLADVFDPSGKRCTDPKGTLIDEAVG